MMDIAVRRAARAAARRLTELDPRLRTQVEAALQAHDDARPHQYTDPVALGSLIVSATGLAWTIYKDRRERAPKPTAKEVIAQVEVKLPASDPVTPAHRTRIIEVVVEEILDNHSLPTGDGSQVDQQQ